ncbi:MAG TPA: hypothetical protein PLS81_05910 [Deltaproteobacteria bacterium]|nr:hypothetical protein [Deltaproteobacteria bacterium]HOM28973.1 hypothetical protein [Deltaproteobacteria bacterium]HPP80398.1 hypothetical protein [Deltaproteobacteria bacterium]
MAADVPLLEALRWAAIVFVAGFIGFFGKYLARLVLDRIHARAKGPGDLPRDRSARKDAPGESPPPVTGAGADAPAPRATDPKVMKKLLKARAKAIKKS